MANKKGSKMLTWNGRLELEKLLKTDMTKAQIAEKLGVSRRTVYYEINRGKYPHRNSDYTEEICYSPQLAQEKIDMNLRNRGTQLKIGKDREYADYLEKMILEKGYSPDAVLGELKVSGKDKEFKTSICTRTLYSYIDKGVFLNLTNKDLVVKGTRKRRYNKVKKKQSRASAGESIEKRPEDVESRETFGHWEMDSVVGPQGKSKNTFLVLDERKTRDRILMKLPDHTDESVVAAIDALETKWGTENFKKVFKSITVDNGSEFANAAGLQRSINGGIRTNVYYCHAYSSWERGTNENQNKMVRRWVPKKTCFDDMSKEEVQALEDWINNYPRRIFGYKSSKMLFRKEMDALGITEPSDFVAA